MVKTWTKRGGYELWLITSRAGARVMLLKMGRTVLLKNYDSYTIETAKEEAAALAEVGRLTEDGSEETATATTEPARG